MSKTAAIILIGNEILSGKVTDLNAAYLCRELRALGVDVRKISVIADDVGLIGQEVAEFAKRYDIVFTSGGVGPTHDDVTIEGVAKGLGVRVIEHPTLVSRLEQLYRRPLNDARLKMAQVPEGAELLADELLFPVIAVSNLYIFPGVPEIFREKFDAIKERFRDQPFHLVNVYVRIGEGTLATYLNELLSRYPDLLLGSYPDFSNPDYKVKVTLESKDRDYLTQALEEFVESLPQDGLVRVE
ncbi:MAG TPA: competence/damage-inducible protein A [Methylomirabilota bacterium]|nr:competence/damage-inducible protein A [Methylomirabilota bacterium]